MTIAAMTDDEWKARRKEELALRLCPFCGYGPDTPSRVYRFPAASQSLCCSYESHQC